MYYHQGQYYFSCGPPRHGAGAARDGGDRALFFLFSNRIRAFLHPFTALRRLAVGVSFDGVRGGIQHIIRALVARLTSNDA